MPLTKQVRFCDSPSQTFKEFEQRHHHMGTGPNTHVGERYAVQSTSFYPLQGKKGEQINGKKKENIET